MSNSPAVRPEEAVVIQDRWAGAGDGYIKTWETRMTFMDFQRREVPNWQRAMADVRIRRALLHATDRQGLVDVLTQGLGSIADAFITRSDPLFPEVDRVISKYPFDPGRAGALFAEAGWRRASPGAPLRNDAGQTFDADIWATEEKEAAILADSWKAAGVNSNPHRVPSARTRDHEYRNSFPAANTGSRSISAENFDFVSEELPRAEVDWLGSNRGSFVDPEIDRLHALWTTSLREQERQDAQIALHRRVSEMVGFGPLFYSVEVILASSRVKGPVGNYGPQVGVAWNIFEWEVTD